MLNFNRFHTLDYSDRNNPVILFLDENGRVQELPVKEEKQFTAARPKSSYVSPKEFEAVQKKIDADRKRIAAWTTGAPIHVLPKELTIHEL